MLRKSVAHPGTTWLTPFFRHGNLARGELHQLRKVIGRLEVSESRMRLAVGAGVCLANTDFIRRFSGIEPFRRVSAEAQRRFCSDLSDLELDLRGQDPGMALGVGLYRIWLADTLAGRRRVAEVLGEALAELSRQASFGGR